MADGRKDFPTIFRIDRIADFTPTGEKFSIPYRDKFSDGEFRKRVQFMYAGKLRCVTFTYSGASIEAILDRLPTAKILSEKTASTVSQPKFTATALICGWKVKETR